MSIVSNLQPAFKDNIQPKLLNAFINTKVITPDDETKEIEQILTKDSGAINAGDIRLFYVDSDPYNAYKLGAYTELKTYARITNITEERLLYLLKNYINPDYIYLPAKEKGWIPVISEHYLLYSISEIPPLYSVSALKQIDDNSIRAGSISDNNWNNGIRVNSPIILFRNSSENRIKLENAVGFEIDGIYVKIVEINEFSEDWIHVRCEANIDLNPFAYPGEIKIIK